MYLLTNWEGWMEKYLARGHGVRTERHNQRSGPPTGKTETGKGPDTNALPDLVEKPDSSFLFVIGPENNTSYISVL